ncbi:unnamed protein product [Camellia sinensis]
MQRDREVREGSINSGGLFDSFGSFGGLGRQRSMMSSIFRGRDPFDDPFFTCPFDSMFGPSMFSSGSPFRDSPQVGGSKGPVIEELNTDDEEEQVDNMGAQEDKEKVKKNNGSNKAPNVEHPDDEADERKSKDVTYRTDYNKVAVTKPQAQSVSFQKVTYGGINGAYYTATTTRKTGGDAVALEECKQADKTRDKQHIESLEEYMTDKGHSVTRKLNSDGKVDTMQALHNLNEEDLYCGVVSDELAGFEQSWKGNAERHLPGWDDRFNFNGTAGASSSGQRGRASGSSWPLPIEGFPARTRTMGAYGDARTSSSGGRPKKVVTINIE